MYGDALFFLAYDVRVDRRRRELVPQALGAGVRTIRGPGSPIDASYTQDSTNDYAAPQQRRTAIMKDDHDWRSISHQACCGANAWRLRISCNIGCSTSRAAKIPPASAELASTRKQVRFDA